MINRRPMLKNRARFWISQIILWTLYAIVSSLGRLTYTHHEYDGPDTIIIIISAILGIANSSMMGNYYQMLKFHTARKILLVSVLTRVFFTYDKTYIDKCFSPLI